MDEKLYSKFLKLMVESIKDVKFNFGLDVFKILVMKKKLVIRMIVMIGMIKLNKLCYDKLLIIYLDKVGLMVGVKLIIILVVFMVVLCLLVGKIDSIIVWSNGMVILILMVWIKCLVNKKLKFGVV